MWGKKTLTTLLQRDYDHDVSESTVGRILTKLIIPNKLENAMISTIRSCH